uniref:Uncharacterized protein n=1 Tax=Heterorhabditis bacteriophora TaxID=37862 RepID=A0A1I7X3I7_HETBA
MFGTSSSFGSKPSSLFGNTSNTTTTNQATEDIAVSIVIIPFVQILQNVYPLFFIFFVNIGH